MEQFVVNLETDRLYPTLFRRLDLESSPGLIGILGQIL